MLVAYATRFNNVKRFVGKVGMASVLITEGLQIDEPFVLVTYTDGTGEVPMLVQEFLKANHHNLMGVAASGNLNWGVNFAKSADRISEQYEVPVILKFEMSGQKTDVKKFIEGVEHIELHRVKQYG